MEKVFWDVRGIPLHIPQRKGDAKDEIGMYHITPSSVPEDDLIFSSFPNFLLNFWKYLTIVSLDINNK